MAFFSSNWFNPKYKTKVHIGQLVLIVFIVALAIGKTVTRPSYIPQNRMDMVAVTMSVKSIIVLAYQLLTEHIARFNGWASLKAYLILNALEVVFWIGVIVVTFMSISMVCVGTSCALGWLLALMAFFMVAACFWSVVVSWADFRLFRKLDDTRDDSLPHLNAH